VAYAVCIQARAEVDAAKQQLVLLQAEADGARIRGNAEAQAAQVSKSSFCSRCHRYCAEFFSLYYCLKCAVDGQHLC
jgi:hypothetical protein